MVLEKHASLRDTQYRGTSIHDLFLRLFTLLHDTLHARIVLLLWTHERLEPIFPSLRLLHALFYQKLRAV